MNGEHRPTSRRYLAAHPPGMTQQKTRVASGVPAGGQFAPTERDAADVLLVEFASDEAEQVDAALDLHETVQEFTGTPETARSTAAARAQVRAMRARLTAAAPFTAAEFDTEQVLAMHHALEFHRARAATPGALAATDAAMFRIDTALTPDEHVENLTEETSR